MNKLSFSLCISFLVILFGTPQVFSQPSTSPTQAEATNALETKIQKQRFKENEDITDAKLRAEGGSLSRYSLRFNFNYYGPTLGDVSEKDQPNPDGSIGSFQTALSGTMGMRYRLNSRSSIGLQGGLKVIYPLHGAERIDFSNPSLNYDYAFRAGELQMRNSPSIIFRTVPEFTRIGQTGYVSDYHSVVYDFGSSRFAVGADVSATVFVYNRAYEPKDGKAPRHSIDFNPNLKFRFSDKLSFITSTNFSWWNPRAQSDGLILLNKAVNQRIGAGYALTRDTYLNPFLAFYPQKLTTENTTLNLSTIFSIF